jgi:hypothetical protein
MEVSMCHATFAWRRRFTSFRLAHSVSTFTNQPSAICLWLLLLVAAQAVIEEAAFAGLA